MEQVSMRRVQLDDVEACRHRTSHGVLVGIEQRLKVARLESAWRNPALAEGCLGRRDRRPRLVAAIEVFLRERTVAIPRAGHARLAAGVGELDRRDRALAPDE